MRILLAGDTGLIGRALKTAADFLHTLALEEVEQVSFSRADHNFRPLYPDLPENRAKVARLLEAYSRALSSLGPEGSLDDVSAGLFFLPRVHISLSGGDSVTIVLHNGVHVYRGDWRRSRRVEEGEVSRELEEVAASLFVPAERVTVDSYVDVSLDGWMWRLYLPAGSGTTVVPLRNLALALDLRLTWNGSTATAELETERLIISAPGPVPR